MRAIFIFYKYLRYILEVRNVSELETELIILEELSIIISSEDLKVILDQLNKERKMITLSASSRSTAKSQQPTAKWRVVTN